MQIMAIMAIFFTSMGVAAVSPAMAKFAAHFKGYNYALISTMPTLFVVPTTLWAGSVAGTKVKYKTLSLVGIILFIAGGILPFFITNSFWFLIFCRALFGIGAGLRSALGNALIIQLLPEEKQPAYLGYGTLVSNFGGIVFQMAGGALAEISWNYTFLAYLFGFLSLALWFFQPEPQEVKIDENKKLKGGKLPLAVFVLALVFLVYSLLNYPTMMNMSLIFESRNAGGSTMAATALSLYTVGGCVTGLLFGQVFRMFRRFTISIGLFISAFGAFLIFVGTNAVVLCAGSILIGMGASLTTPGLYNLLSQYVEPHVSALAISICMAANSLGGFICPYYLNLVKGIVGESLFTTVFLEAALFALIGVLFIVINPYPRRKNNA